MKANLFFLYLTCLTIVNLVKIVFAKKVGDGFGVNVHIGKNKRKNGFKDGELEILKEGFNIVRFDLKWEYSELDCGHYNFSIYDRLIEQLLEADIRPYAILGYSNVCYRDLETLSISGFEYSNFSSATLTKERRFLLPSKEGEKSCNTEKCMAGYIKWAQAVANHYKEYKNQITFTSINEPNNPKMADAPASINAKLTIATGKIFLKAGFEFVGGITEGVDLPYHRELSQKGVLNYVTAMSTHPYSHNDPEVKIEKLYEIRKIMNNHGGKKIKLQLDEWGYPWGGYPKHFEHATRLLPRTWLLCLSFDLYCDLGIYYEWDGVIDLESMKTNNMYTAAKVFQNTIGMAEKFDKLKYSTENTYAARFFMDLKNPYEKAFAVWTSLPKGIETEKDDMSKKINLKTGLPRECWKMITYLGNNLGIQCADNSGYIKLSNINGSPLYLMPTKKKK